MKKIATTLMVVSLTGNIFPAINIVAISGLLPLYLGHRNPQGAQAFAYSPDTARKFLLVAYFYWIASYLCTGAPVANLLSFDFLRFDGALLIAYLPLLLVVDVRLDPAFIRRCLSMFLTILSFVALLGLAEFIDGTVVPLGLAWLPEPLQLLHNASLSTDIFHGLFRAHNAAGAIYAMAALLSFSLLVQEQKPRLFSWPALWLAATVSGLVLTQSRTAYVSFLLTLLIMFFRREFLRRGLKYGILILLPLLYSLLIQPELNHRTEQVSNLEDPNVVTRLVYYQRALNDFLQSPLVGTGFGRFNDELKIYSGLPHVFYFVTSGSVVNDDSHAHNSYLHFSAEGGIVGLSLMLGVWVSLFHWVGRQKAIFPSRSFGYSFAHAIRACILLEFFMSFTEHMMGTAVSSLAILTMVGLLLNLAGWKYRLAALTAPHLAPAGELQMGFAQ
jgi:O-antigen ligase